MTQQSADDIWSAALGELQVQVARANYDTWLKDTKGLSLLGDVFTVGAPTSFAMEWLDKRLTALIRKTVAGILGRDVELRFVVLDAKNAALLSPSGEAPQAGVPPSVPTSYQGVRLNPRYTFASFIVGAPNRFAHAAAAAVAEGPGRSYNPLFLYGGVGLGKTHLLHAIGQHCRAAGHNVLYITSEQFTNEFINALRERKTEEFRAKYRGVDVLLIDDIHFIADKEQTQESFFHTFNDLHNANRQIVISSDRSPRSMPLLEDRLRSRFEWGLIADVQPPDLEMRLAILRSKVEEAHLALPGEVISLIAHRFQSNIRELEGALNRVLAYCQLQHTAPTLEIAEQALEPLLHRAGRQHANPTRIITAVAEYTHVSIEELTGPRRSKDIAFARQIAMYVLRMETSLSFAAIGGALGNRDHSTILHGFEKIADAVEANTSVRRTVAEVTNILRGTAGQNSMTA
ncbi:MAG: chromosomal replication initiator protein DnaA [Dehalococcoidia bacterium]|nr:chromosomal replication initiator protein DnaA [Dehalococcoidia bacterium]